MKEANVAESLILRDARAIERCVAIVTRCKISPAEQLFQVYEKLIEHTLIDPMFRHPRSIRHHPPGPRKHRRSYFADVYELAINGVEISPGYTELNDPDMQAKNFAHQVGDKDEQQKVDEDFLNALRYGMPPAGGMGMGIDRLVMMLTGAESIRDVILFPLMKPQGKRINAKYICHRYKSDAHR